ncbi:MAG: zinc ribbon domain-containing protein, partial [Candidatus Thorarchaeota archaeon]
KLRSGRASFTLIPQGSDLPLEVTRVFSIGNQKDSNIQITLIEKMDDIDDDYRVLEEFTFSNVVYPSTQKPRFESKVAISIIGDLTLELKDLTQGTTKMSLGIVLDTTTSQPTIDLGEVPQIDKMKTQTNIERETILKEIVLVVCPHCGTKNHQGITKCANCGGIL